MADHRRIRRLCAALEDVVRCPGEAGSDQSLAHVWRRLADLLEAHFRAEEEICYLPMFGCSPRPAERWDAVADHDDIRAAMGEASLQPVGSALWWRAVRAVVTASIGHLDWEERGVLAACLPGLTISQRRELGRCWLAFIAAWTLDATPPARTDLPGGVPLPARHRRPGPT